MSRQKDTYYRFTLIKEVFKTAAIAQQRLQQTQSPYSFKTDSLYEKMCALKEGFVVGNTVYFVATDAYIFMSKLPQVVAQLKTHVTPKVSARQSVRRDNKTTQTISSEFASLAQKIEFLQRYVNFRRQYQQLSFAISYHDNSTGRLAAPSDWDIKIIAKIPAQELELWTKGLQPMQKAPVLAWLDPVPTTLDLTGVTEWFQSSGRIVGIDKKRHIVVYRNSTYSGY